MNIFNIYGIFFQMLGQSLGGGMCLLGGGCFDYDNQGIYSLVLWKCFLVLSEVRSKRKVL